MHVSIIPPVEVVRVTYLCTYQYCAPLPLPGNIGGKEGHLPCFDTETCPTSGEFGGINRNYTFSVKVIIFQVSSFFHIAMGFDRLMCLIGGQFEASMIQIPPNPPSCPGGGSGA